MRQEKLRVVGKEQVGKFHIITISFPDGTCRAVHVTKRAYERTMVE